MQQIQSIAILLSLVALAFAPLVLARVQAREDEEQKLPEVLSGVQAYARHLYGEHAGWDERAMYAYDHRTALREPWETAARQRLSARGQVSRHKY